MQTRRISMLADLLMEARLRNRPLAALSSTLRPASVAEAYAVQDEVVARSGGLSGWKVGPPRSPGAEPRCAPVLTGGLRQAPASFVADDFVGLPEVEAEIAVRFGRDIPAGPAPVGADEVRAAIGSVHCALEILSSRFEDRQSLDALVSLADSQSNGAVVLGEGIGDWQSVEFADIAFELSFGGDETLRSEGGPTTADVLDALVWLANHAAARKHGLRAGQVVITGARTKAVRLPEEAKAVTARAAGIGSVSAGFLR